MAKNKEWNSIRQLRIDHIYRGVKEVARLGSICACVVVRVDSECRHSNDVVEIRTYNCFSNTIEIDRIDQQLCGSRRTFGGMIRK